MNPIKLEFEDRKDFGSVKTLKHNKVVREGLENFLPGWPLKIGWCLFQRGEIILT